MTKEFFVEQINRLRIRFGAKAFDPEIVKILGREVSLLPDDFFRKRIDTWIGERKTSSPPLLVDFREARLTYERESFKQETREAAKTFSFSLQDVLRKHYKVDTLKEAFELESLRLRLGEKSDGTRD